MDQRIGAQGYTIRDFIKTPEDLETSLKKLKDIGYQAIQLSAAELQAWAVCPATTKEPRQGFGSSLRTLPRFTKPSKKKA